MISYPNCRDSLQCEMCRSRLSGRKFREGVVAFMPDDTFTSIDFECPQVKEWHDRVVVAEKPEIVIGGFTVSPWPAAKELSGKDPELVKMQSELSKQRFEICKACGHATENGHKCALHKGCCFGAWRARPESRCHADPPKW